MKGLRVVEKSWKPEEEKKLGTIVNESGKEVDVQWDKPGPIATSLKLSELRLFDNGGTGVLHNNVACNECNTYPLRGLRWKCLNCDDYDLCTFCYMADAHNLRHIFLRFKRNDSKGVEIPPRLPLKCTGYAFACGILKNAIVNLRKNSKKKGDTFDHLDVRFSEEHTTQKVQLNIRRMSSEDQKGSHKPVLYLIFDNHQDSNQEQKDSFAVMDEIFEYSIMACTILIRRAAALPLLPLDRLEDYWLHALENAPQTSACTKLTDYVILTWIERRYPQPTWNHRQTEGPGTNNHLEGWHTKLKKRKTSQDVRFLAPQKIKDEQTEYSTTLKSPWMATKSERKKQKEKDKEDATYNTDNIELIASVKDVQSTLDFEALICYVSIGEIQQAVSKSDVIGLVFLALLRNQFYTGAIQLVDTGFVCIRHILVGCQILQDASDDKRNEQIQRETSQRLKLYFTERANLIIRFINEATSKNDVVNDEIGDTVNLAGHLLLNHGYLEDVIKTENKTFLENETVTDILNKMWYGKEKSLIRQVSNKYA
ncbi:MIB [Mytilus coruscus]|uniref:MIB n=1 Tax=Mytilus coruscus TaxID=42192 RepID=A0A6J8AW45_MYTCO|nr:MIB [Mytilus coruscus]